MVNYKEKFARILNEAVEGMEREDLQNLIEIPADNKMGDYAFLVLSWQRCCARRLNDCEGYCEKNRRGSYFCQS